MKNKYLYNIYTKCVLDIKLLWCNMRIKYECMIRIKKYKK